MNIPDEVIERAAHAILDAKYPGIAWRLIHGHSRDLKLQQATAAAEVIAEWARKEALREAREMIERQAPDMGPRILITEYREGLYDGVSRSARAVGRLLGVSS